MARLARIVAELGREVARLRGEVHALRAEMHREVRTRRLVVVDEEGVARVVLGARDGAGTVQARLAGEDGRSNGIELFAVEATDGLAAQIGLEIVRAGDAGERWPPRAPRPSPDRPAGSGTPPGT